MSWFKRVKEGILTRTEDKKGTPDGMWEKCPKCKTALTSRGLLENLYCCTNCNHHFRIGSKEYFNFLFDNGEFQELEETLVAADPLEFVDTKKYPDRVKASTAKTGLADAMRVGHGKMEGEDMVVCCMDFKFIGGSMGSVMGEKMSRAIDFCLEHKFPLVIISKSGGARMMEGAISLMQMAKVSAKLNLLSNEQIPYFRS